MNSLSFILTLALTSVLFLGGVELKGQIDDQTIVHEVLSSPDNPRNSEGDFITLNDGRILFAYTRFTDSSSDHAPARIMGRMSSDQGKTWSTEDLLIVDNEGQQNVMSVSFLRLQNGNIALLYAQKNSLEDRSEEHTSELQSRENLVC